MRTDRIQEQQLQVNVPLDKISPWLSFPTVQQIRVLNADELMEPIFDDITIDHGIVGAFYFLDLLFDFALEDCVELGDLVVFVVFLAVDFLLL